MKFITAMLLLVAMIGATRLMYSNSAIKSPSREPSSEISSIPGDEASMQIADPDQYPPDAPAKELIDMHVHFACMKAKNGCYVSSEFQKNWKMKVYLDSLGVSQNEIDSLGDEVVIDKLARRIENSRYLKKAVVLAVDGVYDHRSGQLDREKTQVLFSNRFLSEEIKKHDNMLLGVSVNPFRKDALRELEWAKEHGAVLVKWIPCIMDFSPADPDQRLEQFYKKLKELRLPLLSHTGDEATFLWSKDELCNPAHLRKPLSMGVTVIGAHMSSHGSYYDDVLKKKRKGYEIVTDLMEQYQNFYVDISAVTQINRYNHVQKAIPFADTGRVLYGSDWPLIAVELGLPLVSWEYYRAQISPQWKMFIPTLDSVFDRDVALKKALGVPDKIFTDTVDFFEKPQ